MATFEELTTSIKLMTIQLERYWNANQYDDALGEVDSIKEDLAKLEKIVEQRFAGETS